ncbi:MAG: hypothetical protein HKN49_02620 [Gammaproteobacteria bacterium]|nr:hypothetical protein [Gammaproteobacteria bacterium]
MKQGFLLLSSCLLLSSPALAADLPGKSGFTLSAGTLGVGLELSHTLPIANLTGRLAWNGYTHDFDDTIDGIDYGADLELNSITALVDWRPWGKVTHFTAGMVYNNNAMTFTGVPGGNYAIGDLTFPADQVGSLKGDVGFDEFVPYAGLGWNVPVAPKTALSLELGVVFQGSPQLTLTADGPLADDPTFQQELERERTEFQDEIKDYEYYPVVALGIQRRF